MVPRDGYDPDFLIGDRVPMPRGTAAVQKDIRTTKQRRKVRDYTHFSVALSTQHRFSRWVAWNIDARKGVMKGGQGDARHFHTDLEAYDATAQVDDVFYARNNLDAGHIASFTDVAWGSDEAAAQARSDSCAYPNITPQLSSFNEGLRVDGVWFRLERAIAKDATGKLVSVFGGPVFDGHDDVPYRRTPRGPQITVPKQFWKIVAYQFNGKLRAQGFLLTQKELRPGGITEMIVAPQPDPMLADFKGNKMRISALEDLVGLKFGPLASADVAPRREPILNAIVENVSPGAWLDSAPMRRINQLHLDRW